MHNLLLCLNHHSHSVQFCPVEHQTSKASGLHSQSSGHWECGYHQRWWIVHCDRWTALFVWLAGGHSSLSRTIAWGTSNKLEWDQENEFLVERCADVYTLHKALGCNRNNSVNNRNNKEWQYVNHKGMQWLVFYLQDKILITQTQTYNLDNFFWIE